MSLQRHFLGWDEAVTAKVCRYLLPDKITGPVDMQDTLIVAPTREAGRRLRAAMARVCAEQGSALLSARVVSPPFFLHPPEGQPDEAGGAAIMAAWTATLLRADLQQFSALFPSPRLQVDPHWALQTGILLQNLRAELADGGFRLRDVAQVNVASIEEPERWEALTRLEALYLQELTRLGLHDSCELKMNYVEAPEVLPEVRRIVIAAVPDPSLLFLRAMKALQGRLSITVLVHAPDSLANAFDEWGRPLPEAWRRREIAIPSPNSNILLAASPESQAHHVLDLMATEAARFGPGDVAIGVPDRSVIPHLEESLARIELPVFDPSDRYLRDHALYRLIRDLVALARTQSYSALRSLLRHPDMLESLGQQPGVEPAALLQQLDAAQNWRLPLRLADLTSSLAALSDELRMDMEALRIALTAVESHLQAFDTRPVPEALRGFLQAVYECRSVSSRNPRDRDLAAAARCVNEVLREFTPSLARECGLDRNLLLDLLLERLGTQTYHREGEPNAVDLEGWLELHWNDAPLLIVTGMNEGIVPDSRLSDVFLPDSLRSALALRDDAGRLARDAYLMRSFVASREGAGRACFIAGKCSEAGDPLRPSRLLFRCGDDELAARAERLFGPARDEKPNVPASVSFKLDARVPAEPSAEARVPSRLSVTAFRDYLACPFRFYLGHVLDMQEMDDRKPEPDAMDFGSIAHTALEEMARDPGMRRCDDEHVLAQFLRDRADREIARRFGATPPLPVLVSREAVKQRLTFAAREQVRLLSEGWEILHCEKKYRATLGGMTISGRIDRVDRHAGTGRLRLIDYKTSDRGTGAAEAHLAPAREETPEYARVEVEGKARRWTDLQLPLYRLLYSTEDPGPAGIELAYFNLPRAVTETRLDRWEEFTDALYDSAVRCAAGVIEGIRARRFWPPNPSVRYENFPTLFWSRNPEDEWIAPTVEGS